MNIACFKSGSYSAVHTSLPEVLYDSCEIEFLFCIAVTSFRIIKL